MAQMSAWKAEIEAIADARERCGHAKEYRDRRFAVEKSDRAVCPFPKRIIPAFYGGWQVVPCGHKTTEVHEARYANEGAWPSDELYPSCGACHRLITKGQKAIGLPPRSEKSEAAALIEKKRHPDALYLLTRLYWFLGTLSQLAENGVNLFEFNGETESVCLVYEEMYGPEPLTPDQHYIFSGLCQRAILYGQKKPIPRIN